MRIAIDGIGRVVIPKRFREHLGFLANGELEISEAKGHLARVQTRAFYASIGSRGVAALVTCQRVSDGCCH